MPTILRKRGCRFYFYAHEGFEPPHLHVDSGSGTLKPWLSSLDIASVENLKPSEIREILKITQAHHTFLLNAWHEFAERKS